MTWGHSVLCSPPTLPGVKVFTYQSQSIMSARGGDRFVKGTRRLGETTGITKNQGNMSPPKESSKSQVTSPKEMETQEFLDKEFKIIV